MKQKTDYALRHIAHQTGFNYTPGYEFVVCRNCGIQYRIADGNAAEMMHSHYPYCRGAGRSRWYPEHGRGR